MKQAQTEERMRMPHLLSMSERNELGVTGVLDVDSFDDLTVVADTEQGQLTIKGRDLHIQRLCVETGDLTVTGRIESLTYIDAPTRSGGFFGKLFR